MSAGILLGFFLSLCFPGPPDIDTLDNRIDGLQQQIAVPAVPQEVQEPPQTVPKALVAVERLVDLTCKRLERLR